MASGRRRSARDGSPVALGLNNLAVLYHAQARYSEADPLFARALAIWERTLGPEHPRFATVLSNTAVFYTAQGRHRDAEALLDRALVIREQALGPEHPDVATSLHNLGSVYRVQGRYDETAEVYRRALAIREAVLGPDHPDVAYTLNNLAALSRVRGRLAVAISLYERALAIWEQTFGPDHPRLAASLNGLAAAVLGERGRTDEAEALFRRALRIVETAHGPVHPGVATILNDLAPPLPRPPLPRPRRVRTGRASVSAVPRPSAETIFGPAHPALVPSLEGYAALLRETGRDSEAAAMETRAQTIREHPRPENGRKRRRAGAVSAVAAAVIRWCRDASAGAAARAPLGVTPPEPPVNDLTGKITLVLENGLRAPVSDMFVPAVRRAGWLD